MRDPLETLPIDTDFLKDKNVTLLFTPGVDTFLTRQYLLNYAPDVNINLIYFDLNSRYSKNELASINVIYGKADNYTSKSINISSIEEADGYVHNRNITIATMSQAIHKSDVVLISGFKDDRVSDNNKQVMDKLSEVLSMTSGKDVKVTSLFWNYEKSEIIDYLVNNGKINVTQLLHSTYSCYDSEFISEDVDTIHYSSELHDKKGEYKLCNSTSIRTVRVTGCRKCKACLRKYSALAHVGYFVPFKDIELMNETINSVDVNVHPYRYYSLRAYLKQLDPNSPNIKI